MTPELLEKIDRIALALERLSPPPASSSTLETHDAYIWHGSSGVLRPVEHFSGVDLALLRGIDRQSRLVLENTRHFAAGRTGNNVMLWGARGMGKSSLVKACFAETNRVTPHSLVLIEIQRDDLYSNNRETEAETGIPYVTDMADDAAKKILKG